MATVRLADGFYKYSGEPTHHFCALCEGAIPKGVMWTLTRQLQRVHADRDDCIAVLHPMQTRAFLKANPFYKSAERY